MKNRAPIHLPYRRDSFILNKDDYFQNISNKDLTLTDNAFLIL